MLFFLFSVITGAPSSNIFFQENIKEIVLQMEDFVWILQRILRLRVYKSLSILSRWQKSQYFAILTSRSLVVERIVIRCPDD